jgi:hypothetical protein
LHPIAEMLRAIRGGLADRIERRLGLVEAEP